MLPSTAPTKILSFALDGGYYILGADSKIYRYLSINPEAGLVSLTINKLIG